MRRSDGGTPPSPRSSLAILALLLASVAVGPRARADEGDGKGDSSEKTEDKPSAEKESGSKKSNLVGRVNSEISAYSDTEAVSVFTPTVGASIENPLSEWSVGASYLVDAVSAASVDIVATASRQWREVRHAGNFDAAYKVGGVVGLGASGSFSVEPDYVGWGVGGTASIDLFQKNATLLVGYSYGRNIIGRGGHTFSECQANPNVSYCNSSPTPFDVFSRVVVSHSINGALTLLVNRDTIMSFVGDAIIEIGDSSKPYRYVPMFAPDVASQVPVGASIDTVSSLRLPERPLEQLPTSRDRFALTVRLAHRFHTSTLRVSERFYRDTWGLTASSTAVRYIFDLGTRVSLWPQARLHLQTPVAFWQRAYVVNYTPGGQWDVPALRTGDRELGPLRGITGGGGIQIRVGPEASPASYTLNLAGQAVYTSYLDDLYITSRVSGLGTMSVEAVFE